MKPSASMSGCVPPIALTVLGGFLGAGKTTLINHVIRHPDADRIAVLVNDFGMLDIDAQLIVSRQYNTISLANGCICCSIGGDLTKALLNISRLQPRPEQLLIETSGVADPSKVAAFGRVGKSFLLHGVIVVADAEQIRQQIANPQLSDTISRQLSSAHVIALNKCDRVAAIDRVELNKWLNTRFGSARVIDTCHANLPAELVLRRFTDQPTPVLGKDAQHTDEHLHSKRFVAFTYQDERPFRRDALRRVLENANGLLRAKGVLRLTTTPESLHVLQLVGSHWTLTSIDSEQSRTGNPTGLVFIGQRSTTQPEKLLESLAHTH